MYKHIIYLIGVKYMKIFAVFLAAMTIFMSSDVFATSIDQRITDAAKIAVNRSCEKHQIENDVCMSVFSISLSAVRDSVISDEDVKLFVTPAFEKSITFCRKMGYTLNKCENMTMDMFDISFNVIEIIIQQSVIENGKGQSL